METTWQKYIQYMPSKWDTTITNKVPSYYLSKNSTVADCEKSNKTFKIIELAANFATPYLFETGLKFVTSRNILMEKESKPWLLASSWISNTSDQKILDLYQSLGSKPLGKLIFTKNWQRSDFIFSDQKYFFYRRSSFSNSETIIVLLEAFIKDTCDERHYY